METGEHVLLPATATAPTAGGDSTASSPPLGDSVIIMTPDPAIDVDDVAEPEIHALISDEEHDHEREIEIDHDFDHENEHELDQRDDGQEPDHVAETVVSLDDLKLKIIKQVNPSNCNWLLLILSCEIELIEWVEKIERKWLLN